MGARGWVQFTCWPHVRILQADRPATAATVAPPSHSRGTGGRLDWARENAVLDATPPLKKRATPLMAPPVADLEQRGERQQQSSPRTTAHLGKEAPGRAPAGRWPERARDDQHPSHGVGLQHAAHPHGGLPQHSFSS